ncbi:MAG: DUF1800 domain-containing protein [Myxococcota bacterium]
MSAGLEAWVPTRSQPWDEDAAAHLWRRAGFGATRPQLERALADTPAAAVSGLVTGPADDPACVELESIYPVLLAQANADALRSWLVARMIRCEHQLREKIALFWHGHFATSIAKVREPVWMSRQYGIFLERGLGRFAELLAAITRDPAMIRWLDNETNRKGQPNENFARELFELFTLGVGHYGEHDVSEAARAFTGWTVLADRFHFSVSSHDAGDKTVLGQTGPWSGDDVLRIALGQAACAEFLAGKLLRFFAHPDPPPELTRALADVLRDSDYDVGRTLEHLLRSRFFFDLRVRRGLVKSPVEYAVGAIRTLGVRAEPAELVPALREMGQDLLAPPNVAGWPGHTEWINTATWLTRVNTARGLAERLAHPASGEAGLERHSRALLGRELDARLRTELLRDEPLAADLAHGLLALPEAHLN